MLNAYNVRMISRRLESKKVAILEEVLSIKFFLKHSLSIFVITHFRKSRYGCCPAGIFKSPDMVIVLLAFFFKKKPRYDCCHAGTYKSLGMVATLLAFSKSRQCSQPADTFKRPDCGSKPAGTFKRLDVAISLLVLS